jgi:hypothetical protein
MHRCLERFIHYMVDDPKVLPLLHLLLVIEGNHGLVPQGAQQSPTI